MGSRSRAWCYTITKTETEDLSRDWTWKEIDCIYHIMGYEVCPTTKRPHIQGFIYFENGKTMNAVKTLFQCKEMHLETKRGTFKQASDYCKKENEFYECGVLPDDPQDKGQKSREIFENAIKAARVSMESLESLDPINYVRYFSTFEKISKAGKAKPANISHYPGMLFTGAPNGGKSRLARFCADESFYLKDKNTKWWDNYNGEPFVLLDDVSPNDVSGNINLWKQWFDIYPFIGEIKGLSGGTGWIRPKTICITSNYSFEELFPDNISKEAMRRRIPLHRRAYDWTWNQDGADRFRSETLDPKPLDWVSSTEPPIVDGNARNFII